MPQKKETLSARVTRLEESHIALAGSLKDLADTVKGLSGKVEILLDAQIKTDERFRQTDERIEKLVIAIGELISRMPITNGSRHE
jgi:hypothetical protein